MHSYIDYIINPQRGCAIVAHRGAWHHAPENSLLALEHAIIAGYPIAEIDIRQSSDGELFLLHDDTLERMAGIGLNPELMTWAELRGIRLRDRDGGIHNPFTEQCIPTLQDVLTLAKDRLFLDLDVKYPELLPQVVDYVKTFGSTAQVDIKATVNNSEHTLTASWMDILTDIPFMPKSHFTAQTADAVIDILKTFSPFMCEASFDHLATLARCKSRFSAEGIAIWVNTLNEVACVELNDSAALKKPDVVWGALLDAGVSVIQTDEPEALEAYLRTRIA